jgi:HD-GYP domain-containing protein (c-di-GMP phosphodiesterase class II)
MAENTELDPLRQVFGQRMKPLVDTITALGFALEARDSFTQRPSLAVPRLAAQIARQMR